MTTEAASYVRLMNGYFSRPDYFQADVEKGTIRTPNGVRICALTDDFLRGFRAAVKFECGKATDRIFKKCGKRWGHAFAERFDRELMEHYGVPVGDISTGIIERCLDEAFRFHGWGRLKLDFSSYDHGLVGVTITDPVMPSVVGAADKPSDSLFAGFLAAVISFYAKTELDCQQTDCPSRGADASRFIVTLEARMEGVPSMVNDGLNHIAIMRRLKTLTLNS